MASKRKSHNTCKIAECWESDNGHNSGYCPKHRNIAATGTAVKVGKQTNGRNEQ